MAAKEHQGLTITVIVLAMLTVIGFGMTFYFYRSLEEEANKSAKAAKDAATATQAKTQAENEATDVKKMIGFGPEEKMEAIKETYEADLKRFGDNFPKVEMPADQRHYRRLAEYLYTEVRDANKRLVAADEDKQKLNEKIIADAAAKQTEISGYVATINKTQGDLKTRSEEFAKQLASANKKSEDLSAKLDEARNETKDAVSKKDQNIQKLEKDLNILAGINKDLSTDKKRRESTAGLLDGKISWVNQKSRIVWLNIGSRDGLNRQTTFSVLGSDESNPDKARQKGKIEVTQILDDHMAEARILEDSISDPLMPGDVISSPTYQAGQQEHFAFVGKMDIDGDKKSDRAELISLIERSGGKVDAEITDTGEKLGEISVQTNYLVLGSRPDETTTEEYRKNYAKLLTEAEQLGVRQISLTELLDRMGYKTTERVVPLGKDVRASDFKPPLPGGVQRTTITGRLKPRTPPKKEEKPEAKESLPASSPPEAPLDKK